jgi:plasmid stabilization system protein ParE
MANPSEVFHHPVTARERRTRGYIKRWHKSATAVEAARLRIRSLRAVVDASPSETPGFATPELYALRHRLLSHKACSMLLVQLRKYDPPEYSTLSPSTFSGKKYGSIDYQSVQTEWYKAFHMFCFGREDRKMEPQLRVFSPQITKFCVRGRGLLQ